MKFVKSEDGERVNVINGNEEVIAYIEKNRFGTHGHWHGWKHYVYCEKAGQIMYAGIYRNVIDPKEKEKPFDPWSDEPVWFGSIKEFKTYYERKKIA